MSGEGKHNVALLLWTMLGANDGARTHGLRSHNPAL